MRIASLGLQVEELPDGTLKATNITKTVTVTAEGLSRAIKLVTFSSVPKKEAVKMLFEGGL